MPNYVLDSSAASVNNAINKVVNMTEQPTAGNDNTVKSSGVKTYVDNAIASQLATQLATIKAGFRPKYAQLTGGTHSLFVQNQSNNLVYNIADFTVNMTNHPDFATSKIIGLLVQGYVRSPQGANEILYYLPEGGATRLCRTAASGAHDNVQVSITDVIPVNPNQTNVTFGYGVGDTTNNPYNEISVRGVLYLPGLD